MDYIPTHVRAVVSATCLECIVQRSCKRFGAWRAHAEALACGLSVACSFAVRFCVVVSALDLLFLPLLWDRWYAWSASLAFGLSVVVACIFRVWDFDFSPYRCVHIHIHMYTAREPAFSPLTVEKDIA